MVCQWSFLGLKPVVVNIVRSLRLWIDWLTILVSSISLNYIWTSHVQCFFSPIFVAKKLVTLIYIYIYFILQILSLIFGQCPWYISKDFRFHVHVLFIFHEIRWHLFWISQLKSCLVVWWQHFSNFPFHIGFLSSSHNWRFLIFFRGVFPLAHQPESHGPSPWFGSRWSISWTFKAGMMIC